MIKKIIIIMAIIIPGIFYSTESVAACTIEQAKNAEEHASTIRSWKALYQSFIKYHECDDGAIGEGFSDSVVRLLINDWSNIDYLQKIVDKNPSFESFVLRHIDELMSPVQLTKIDDLAQNSCPKRAKHICVKIEMRINRVKAIVKQTELMNHE